MERPPSQAENVRPSGLKQPSRLPAMPNSSGRTLLETSQSDLNSKTAAASASMPPPNGGGVKHKLAGLPEPPTKRKTLAERAGEPVNPPRSHMPAPAKPSTLARSTDSTARTQSNMGGWAANGYRSLSNASTNSTTSNGSVRPASRQNVSRLIGATRPPSAADTRAVMEEAEAEAGVTGKRKAWDTKGRLEDMEHLYSHLRTQFAEAGDAKNALEETLALYKSQVHELAQQKQELNHQIREISSSNRNLTSDLERARNDLHATTTDLRQARRDNERDMQDAERKHERELGDLYSKQEKESLRLERELEKIVENGEREIQEAKRTWEKQKDAETAELTTQHWEEVDGIKASHHEEAEKLRAQIEELQRSGESRATESATEVQALRDSVASLQGQIETSNMVTQALRSQITAAESRIATLEQEKASLVSKTHFLEGNQEAQSQEFTTMQEQLQDAIDSRDNTLELLRKEEMARRKLNAIILELKGNIRVFARTRPLLAGEEEPAKVDYPDLDDLDGGKEMVVQGPKQLTATGKERVEKHNYAFDRVFGPTTANSQVFDDCRELIQSVVDGYNVSILSYGQTGSGKTFGMSGPEGIIPSSISMLLSEMQRLREKGWEYVVEASFVEVYNEAINDLLGDAKTWDDGGVDDLNASLRGKKKERHEIHHDSVTGKTTVSNLSSVSLWPPPENEGSWPPPAPTSLNGGPGSTYTEQAVSKLLETAAKNRRVAATKSNERSSRSHSIFMLTLRGSCAATDGSSEGVLNLVDLAGSERLKQSGAEGNRMKETQAINKSLSSLGDVIAALGNKKGDESHIPYRNSKLTYLLQSSLGGTTASGKSSRTLMLLHLSPLQAHWQESRSSLLFGSKVHGTHIGAAKKR